MELTNIATAAKSLANTFVKGDALTVSRVKIILKSLKDNKVGDKGAPSTRRVLIALSDAIKLVAPAHTVGYSLSNLQHYAKVGRTIETEGLALDAPVILALYGTIYRGGAGAYEELVKSLASVDAAAKNSHVVETASELIAAEDDRKAAIAAESKDAADKVEQGEGVVIDLSDEPTNPAAFVQNVRDALESAGFTPDQWIEVANGLASIADELILASEEQRATV